MVVRDRLPYLASEHRTGLQRATLAIPRGQALVVEDAKSSGGLAIDLG